MTLRITVQLSHLALLTVVFLVYLLYIMGRVGAGAVYNSDQVHLFLLVDDLLKDPTALFSWYHSPALYTFPNWFLGAFVVAMPLPGGWMPLIYGALMMALYSIAAGALLATTGEVRLVSGAWMIAAMLVCGGLAVLVFNNPGHSRGLYLGLAAAYVHGGAALATLAASALFLHLLHESRPPAVAAFVGQGVLTFAASFSDLLFSAWFVGPACVTGLLYAYATRRPRGVVLAALVAATALGAFAIERTVHDVGAKYMAGSQGSSARAVEVLREALTHGRHPLDVPMLVVLLSTLALLVRGLILTLGLLRRQTPSCGQIMEIFLAGICATALSAPLATNMVTDSGSLRYFIILMLVPLVWIGYHSLRTAARSSLHRPISMIPAALTITASVMAVPAWSYAKRVAGAQPIQLCLDAQGRTAGLSDYWTAKELMLRSDRRIHVMQITDNGEPYRWNTNERWFWSRADKGGPPYPDFIIPRGLDAESLRRAFGLPDRVMNCGGEELWLYNAPLSFVSGHPSLRAAPRQ